MPNLSTMRDKLHMLVASMKKCGIDVYYRLDPIGSHGDKQEINDFPFDKEESSNSEKNESKG